MRDLKSLELFLSPLIFTKGAQKIKVPLESGTLLY
jgi:hypothetical protein